jgi:hypothetical protein
MKASPSTLGSDGGTARGAKGRFLPGNKEGRGNPLAGKVAKLRGAMVASITTKDIRAIMDKVKEKAKTGDTASAKLVFERTLGPVEAVDVLAELGELRVAVDSLLQARKLK